MVQKRSQRYLAILEPLPDGGYALLGDREYVRIDAESIGNPLVIEHLRAGIPYAEFVDILAATSPPGSNAFATGRPIPEKVRFGIYFAAFQFYAISPREVERSRGLPQYCFVGF